MCRYIQYWKRPYFYYSILFRIHTLGHLHYIRNWDEIPIGQFVHFGRDWLSHTRLAVYYCFCRKSHSNTSFSVREIIDIHKCWGEISFAFQEHNYRRSGFLQLDWFDSLTVGTGKNISESNWKRFKRAHFCVFLVKYWVILNYY